MPADLEVAATRASAAVRPEPATAVAADATGPTVPRLSTRRLNAYFGGVHAVNGAQAMRTVQVQIRFGF